MRADEKRNKLQRSRPVAYDTCTRVADAPLLTPQALAALPAQVTVKQVSEDGREEEDVLDHRLSDSQSDSYSEPCSPLLRAPMAHQPASALRYSLVE